MKEYAIFDLDGTLIDSFECICRNINKTLLSFDCPTCTKSQFEEYRHKDLNELFSFAVETTKGKVSMPLFKSIFDKMHLDDCVDGMTVIKKTKRLLEDSKQKGLGIIVLTNKKQEIADKICNNLFPIDTFDFIIGRLDEKPIKIASSVYSTLKKQGRDLHIVAYYGNSINDEEISRRLHVKFTNINDIMEKKKIFIAAPFFSPAEKYYNLQIEKICHELEYETFLAQREVGIAKNDTIDDCFIQDLKRLQNADIIVANLDGIDVDSGTAWEIGYAYSMGKIIIGLREDVRMYRTFLPVNLMINQSCTQIIKLDELSNCLQYYK